ncbi:MAG: hypothetical protein KA144_11715 [Xanthomonadaceae bacterium]|nr:hypothetical protein [Xanthomonadaceae bacterium]
MCDRLSRPLPLHRIIEVRFESLEQGSISRCRATYFSLLVQRKVGKRKHFSPTKQSWSFIAEGIFRFAVHGESKNGGHPSRRPLGLERIGRIPALTLSNALRFNRFKASIEAASTHRNRIPHRAVARQRQYAAFLIE